MFIILNWNVCRLGPNWLSRLNGKWHIIIGTSHIRDLTHHNRDLTHHPWMLWSIRDSSPFSLIIIQCILSFYFRMRLCLWRLSSGWRMLWNLQTTRWNCLWQWTTIHLSYIKNRSFIQKLHCIIHWKTEKWNDLIEMWNQQLKSIQCRIRNLSRKPWLIWLKCSEQHRQMMENHQMNSYSEENWYIHQFEWSNHKVMMFTGLKDLLN